MDVLADDGVAGGFDDGGKAGAGFDEPVLLGHVAIADDDVGEVAGGVVDGRGAYLAGAGFAGNFVAVHDFEVLDEITTQGADGGPLIGRERNACGGEGFELVDDALIGSGGFGDVEQAGGGLVHEHDLAARD